MIALYQQAIACGALRALDVQFALTISQQDPAIMLAAACLSAQSGAGHVCLSLEQLHPQQLFDGRFPALAEALSATLDDAQTIEWRERLLQHPAVSDGSRPSPLVLVEQRLYLQRMWQSEREVAAFLHTAACQDIANVVDDESLREILDRLFGNAVPGDIDWQKVAAAVAVTRRLAIISGGPGTGKTTTVAKLLAALLQLMPETALRIQMAAPTGKAAARLTSSLGQATAGLALDETLRQRLPNEAFTLHRLLGAQGSSLRMRYHKENPLHLDVLVVDEASMVDLPMMARLIDALPAHARLILLGDRDQLASVEAGAVLGDICRFAEQGYSADRAAQLTRQTGYPVQGNIQGSSAIADSLCLLRKSYRFSSASGIGTLATAVNCGDVFAARAVLSQPRDDIALYPLAQTEDFQALLTACAQGYQPYLQLVAAGESAQAVLAAFSRFQVLCALRDGPFGVSGLNMRIEQTLSRMNVIERMPYGQSRTWYAGRPIMISRNDSALGLFNGDIGIALPDSEGELRVYFQLSDGSVKSVQPSRLPVHDTAYAMTVHKSQGSEFTHTLLVLPNHFSPILTRELVYTAMTRARERLSLYASLPVLEKAILQPTRRRSGLAEYFRL